MTGQVVQVSVGTASPRAIGDTMVSTAIVKEAVEGPAWIGDDRVEGDEQASTEHHGGYWQAVYAYDRASTDHWAEVVGRPLPHGWFGENLTLTGVNADSPVVGTTWRVGQAELAVTGPRIPCAKLVWRMQRPGFAGEFLAAERTGSYLRIVAPGTVRAGDAVEVLDVPGHGVTIVDVARAWAGDVAAARRVLDAEPIVKPGVLVRLRQVVDRAG